MGTGSRLLALGALFVLGCGGGGDTPAPPPPSVTTTVPAAPTTPPAEAAPPAPVPEATTAVPAPVAPPPPSGPMSDELDLLHAIHTEIAVSSAYRDQAAQIGRLFDGDPNTAWNSRTGDLVGAWIEIRIPAGAEVDSIDLIPGFARTDGETSLFTGNHRVSGVRVLLNGEELDTLDVATDSPEMVHLGVVGGGGVYRIEITSVLPGSRTDWQEICISELQVIGRAPGAIEGSAEPIAAIGTLPDVWVPDRASIEASHVREDRWLPQAWYDFELEVAVEPGMAARRGRPIDGAGMDATRDEILERTARMVAPVDGARAAALRAEVSAVIAWDQGQSVCDRAVATAADLVIAAHEAVATYLADDAARCRTARTASAIRLGRLSVLASSAVGDNGDADGPGYTEAQFDAILAESEALDNASEGWGANPQAVGTRVLAMSPPTHLRPRGAWPELQTRLTAARDACGWSR